jgi:hypothetical protein
MLIGEESSWNHCRAFKIDRQNLDALVRVILTIEAVKDSGLMKIGSNYREATCG